MIVAYEFLKLNNIEVYFVGQHKGLTTSNYVVLKDNGTVGENNSNKIGSTYLDIIIYVPKNRYTEMEAFKIEVKRVLKGMNNLRYVGSETPIVTDDEKQALTCSILYQKQRKLEG